MQFPFINIFIQKSKVDLCLGLWLDLSRLSGTYERRWCRPGISWQSVPDAPAIRDEVCGLQTRVVSRREATVVYPEPCRSGMLRVSAPEPPATAGNVLPQDPDLAGVYTYFDPVDRVGQILVRPAVVGDPDRLDVQRGLGWYII